METQLEKREHINLLMDCYGDLLTDKQNIYLNYYYQEDLSLSEIADELKVSRNAVYDNLKRAVRSLERYEEKLHLVEKHEERMALIDKIEKEEAASHDSLNEYLKMLKDL